MPQLVAFLDTDDTLSQREIKKAMPFTTALRKKNLGIKVTKNEKDLVHSAHGGKERKNVCGRGMYGSKIWKATQVNGSVRHAH